MTLIGHFPARVPPWGLVVAEVRYERSGAMFDVDPDEYAEATPDPLRAIEFDLIADLADHHVDEMAAYVRRQLGPAARPGDEPRVVRLDRYLLHPLLCHRCVGHPA